MCSEEQGCKRFQSRCREGHSNSVSEDTKKRGIEASLGNGQHLQYIQKKGYHRVLQHVGLENAMLTVSNVYRGPRGKRVFKDA